MHAITHVLSLLCCCVMDELSGMTRYFVDMQQSSETRPRASPCGIIVIIVLPTFSRLAFATMLVLELVTRRAY